MCYEKGSVVVYGEGRYGINSTTFETGAIVNTQHTPTSFVSSFCVYVYFDLKNESSKDI